MSQIMTIRVNGSDRTLLTIPEACTALNIGRSRLYTMVSGPEPELRAIHVGRSIRVPASAIQDWLERRAAEPGVA